MGGAFGELALMYNAPRAATVKAATDATLFAVDRTTFKLILMDSALRRRDRHAGFLSHVRVRREPPPPNPDPDARRPSPFALASVFLFAAASHPPHQPSPLVSAAPRRARSRR